MDLDNLRQRPQRARDDAPGERARQHTEVPLGRGWATTLSGRAAQPTFAAARVHTAAGTEVAFLPGWPDGFLRLSEGGNFLITSPASTWTTSYGDQTGLPVLSTFERADLVRSPLARRGDSAGLVVAFDYSCIVSLELLARQIGRNGRETISGSAFACSPAAACARRPHPRLVCDAAATCHSARRSHAEPSAHGMFAPFLRPSSRTDASAAEMKEAPTRSAGATACACCPPRRSFVDGIAKHAAGPGMVISALGDENRLPALVHVVGAPRIHSRRAAAARRAAADFGGNRRALRAATGGWAAVSYCGLPSVPKRGTRKPPRASLSRAASSTSGRVPPAGPIAWSPVQSR